MDSDMASSVVVHLLPGDHTNSTEETNVLPQCSSFCLLLIHGIQHAPGFVYTGRDMHKVHTLTPQSVQPMVVQNQVSDDRSPPNESAF